ncbi:MAG: cobyric acid synthase [Candidatus Omnitrophica bacterium]|nr:cobyric acid synthase [Candidatus Omnitrophota bacterium]
MKAKTLMIQGTASHVGKSVMCAALCRIFKRRGLSVAPFKAQNMSNNSFVTREGLEMGRAQAVQAHACGIEPSVIMNPVLLKPHTDRKAQVVVMGKPLLENATLLQDNYREMVQPAIDQALEELMETYDLVIIEGAGSPAEMNLKDRDLVNMSIARKLKSPVILVGDIDWGGIFAQLTGTYELLDPEEKELVAAFLINKFRGDLSSFDKGREWIEKRTQRKVLGVVPFISDLDLAEEDSISDGDSYRVFAGLRANVALDQISGLARDRRRVSVEDHQLLIDVLWLPRISNFTDFDLLSRQKNVVLRYLHEPDRLRIPDALIIPGTKSTIADLRYLEKTGLTTYIRRCHAAGSVIVGICGGYQMLGTKISDPLKIESSEETQGLGLLPIETMYEPEKTTRQIKVRHLESGLTVGGYEIHMGTVKFKKVLPALFKNDESQHDEGVCLDAEQNGIKQRILGTYMHDLFNDAGFLTYFLSQLSKRAGLPYWERQGTETQTGDLYDRLADRVEPSIDMSYLLNIVK